MEPKPKYGMSPENLGPEPTPRLVLACSKGKNRSEDFARKIEDSEFLKGGLEGLLKRLDGKSSEERAAFLQRNFAGQTLIIINDTDELATFRQALRELDAAHVSYHVVPTSDLIMAEMAPEMEVESTKDLHLKFRPEKVAETFLAREKTLR